MYKPCPFFPCGPYETYNKINSHLYFENYMILLQSSPSNNRNSIIFQKTKENQIIIFPSFNLCHIKTLMDFQVRFIFDTKIFFISWPSAPPQNFCLFPWVFYHFFPWDKEVQYSLFSNKVLKATSNILLARKLKLNISRVPNIFVKVKFSALGVWASL